MNKLHLILLPLALGLAACGPAPSDDTAPVADTAAATPAPAAAAASATPQVEVAPTKMIHAEPAALADCNAAVVTVNWDVRKERPEITTVKIYTSDGKLFTHSGGVGSLETGSWVKPGSVFFLKSAVDETELERLTIGGPVCP